MSVLALDFLADARRQLNDETGTFWGFFEVQQWLNLGLRTMCNWKPDSYVLPQWVDIVQGPRQSIPLNALYLFDVVRNDPDHGGGISLMERKDLPDGWAKEQVVDGIGVQHFMYLPQDRKHFYIYPSYRQTTRNRLDCVCGMMAPALDVYLPSNALNAAASSKEIVVDDTDALLSYCLYRAHLKLTTEASVPKASFAAQQFLIAIGKGREAALMANPQRILNVQGEQV